MQEQIVSRSFMTDPVRGLRAHGKVGEARWGGLRPVRVVERRHPVLPFHANTMVLPLVLEVRAQGG